MAQNETIQGQSLTTREGYLFFLVDMLELGRKDPDGWPWRQYGALSAWAKLYADVQGWVPKTPINLTQVVSQQVTGPTREDYDRAVSEMSGDEQLILARAIDRLQNGTKPP